MKKATAILLSLCLCIILCACANNAGPAEATKSAEARKADELILAIGEVTLEKETAILTAQTYYDTLTDTQKAEVEHLALLQQAQKQYEDIRNESIYAQAMGLEKNDPDKAVELYSSLPTDYKDVASRLKALEKTEYEISVFTSCSIMFELNGAYILSDTHSIELETGKDLKVMAVPVCEHCGSEQAPVEITFQSSAFEEKETAQELSYATCSNNKCDTIMFLYGINVRKIVD